jgi:hypothetical protein
MRIYGKTLPDHGFEVRRRAFVVLTVLTGILPSQHVVKVDENQNVQVMLQAKLAGKAATFRHLMACPYQAQHDWSTSRMTYTVYPIISKAHK